LGPPPIGAAPGAYHPDYLRLRRVAVEPRAVARSVPRDPRMTGGICETRDRGAHNDNRRTLFNAPGTGVPCRRATRAHTCRSVTPGSAHLPTFCVRVRCVGLGHLVRIPWCIAGLSSVCRRLQLTGGMGTASTLDSGVPGPLTGGTADTESTHRAGPATRGSWAASIGDPGGTIPRCRRTSPSRSTRTSCISRTSTGITSRACRFGSSTLRHLCSCRRVLPTAEWSTTSPTSASAASSRSRTERRAPRSWLHHRVVPLRILP
jgi:hypothetical protein